MDNASYNPEWQKLWDTIQSLKVLSLAGDDIFPHMMESLYKQLQLMAETPSNPPPFFKELQQDLNELIQNLIERRHAISQKIGDQNRQRTGMKTYLTS